MTRHTIYFSGVTGRLGQVIAAQLIADKFEVIGLLRNGHTQKHAEVLKKLGIKHVEAEGKEDIAAKTKGAHAIISTVAGDDKAFVNYQLELLHAAKANNALFIPSEFGSDFEDLSNPGFFGYKQALREEVKKSGVQYCFVQNGNFFEFGFSAYFKFDVASGKVEILGDGNVPVRRTAMKDIAKGVSTILRIPNPPQHAYIASEVLTERQAIEIFEEVFGKKFEVVSKTKDQFQKDCDNATEFFPGKFSAWLHSVVDKVAVRAVNIQIPGSQSVREYAQQIKAGQHH